MKYIEAEKLKEEIEKRRKFHIVYKSNERQSKNNKNNLE